MPDTRTLYFVIHFQALKTQRSPIFKLKTVPSKPSCCPIHCPQAIPNTVNSYAQGPCIQIRYAESETEAQLESLINQIKKTVLEKGYKRCVCRRPVSQCVCRDPRDLCTIRQFILDCEEHFEVFGLTERIRLDDLEDKSTLALTPPPGMMTRPMPAGRGMFKRMTTVETQYDNSMFGERPSKLDKDGEIALSNVEQDKAKGKNKIDKKKGKKEKKNKKDKKSKKK